jgi:hydrogenase nickel incorporation protein HypA/HybF
MHEMSLAEGVRGIIDETARAQDLRRISAVVLEIGELATVEVESLRFCLEVVLRGTVADGARIDVEAVPGTGWCMQCAASVAVSQLYDPCPRCGSYQVQPTGGTEMRVAALEAE